MSSVNYSQLIPNSANLSWFSASSRVGDALGIAPPWEGRGALSTCGLSKGAGMQVHSRMLRVARAGVSLPSPQPQLQPEANARRG